MKEGTVFIVGVLLAGVRIEHSRTCERGGTGVKINPGTQPADRVNWQARSKADCRKSAKATVYEDIRILGLVELQVGGHLPDSNRRGIAEEFLLKP